MYGKMIQIFVGYVLYLALIWKISPLIFVRVYSCLFAVFEIRVANDLMKNLTNVRVCAEFLGTNACHMMQANPMLHLNHLQLIEIHKMGMSIELDQSKDSMQLSFLQQFSTFFIVSCTLNILNPKIWIFIVCLTT